MFCITTLIIVSVVLINTVIVKPQAILLHYDSVEQGASVYCLHLLENRIDKVMSTAIPWEVWRPKSTERVQHLGLVEETRNAEFGSKWDTLYFCPIDDVVTEFDYTV